MSPLDPATAPARTALPACLLASGAAWDGSGDPDHAGSFRCEAAAVDASRR